MDLAALRRTTTWPALARKLALAALVARRLGPTEVSSQAATEWDAYLPPGPWEDVPLPDVDLRDPGMLGRAYQAWHLPAITAAAAQARKAGTKLEGEALIRATQLYSEPSMARFLAEHAPGASVVDPACGAGQLLLAALAAGATHLSGCDLDGDALELARCSLLQRARELGREITLDLLHADGLTAFEGRRFDAVLANPPYMGRKLMPRDLARRLPKEAGGDLFAAFLLRALELVRPGGALGLVTMKAWLYQDGFKALRARFFRAQTLVAFSDLGSGAFAPELELHEGVSVALTCWRAAPPPADHVVQGSKGAKQVAFPQAQLLELPGMPFCYDLPAALRALLARGGDLHGCVKQGLATTDNARFLRYAWEVPPSPRWVPCARGGTYRKWAGLDYERVDWEDDGARIKALIPQKYPYLDGWQWVAKNSQWYFQPGLTYGYMAYGCLGARELEHAVFEVASIGVFPQARGLDKATVFAALNCRTASWILRALSQKHMFQAGMAERLPLPVFDDRTRATVAELVAWCVAAKRRLLRADPREGGCDPAVWDVPIEVAMQEAAREAAWLHAAEGALEALVCEGYGLDEEALRHLVAETGTPAGWLPLSRVPEPPAGLPTAVLHHLANPPGPFQAGDGTPMPAETPIEARALELGVNPLELIEEAPGDRQAWAEDGLMIRTLRAIQDEIWVIGEARPELGTDLHPDPVEWLATRFFRYQSARLKRRPIIWHLASRPKRGRRPAYGCLVNAHVLAGMGLAALAERVPVTCDETRAFAAALRALAWDPDVHDGIKAIMAPLQAADLLAPQA